MSQRTVSTGCRGGPQLSLPGAVLLISSPLAKHAAVRVFWTFLDEHAENPSCRLFRLLVGILQKLDGPRARPRSATGWILPPKIIPTGPVAWLLAAGCWLRSRGDHES
jgi:hypothetical protein